jgi:hypothetical protein
LFFPYCRCCSKTKDRKRNLILEMVRDRII